MKDNEDRNDRGAEVKVYSSVICIVYMAVSQRLVDCNRTAKKVTSLEMNESEYIFVNDITTLGKEEFSEVLVSDQSVWANQSFHMRVRDARKAKQNTFAVLRNRDVVKWLLRIFTLIIAICCWFNELESEKLRSIAINTVR